METKKLILDAKGAIFGRLCSFAAKKALEGNEIIILNSEKTLISGNKKDIIRKYKVIKEKGGHSLKGPKYSRIPYRMLKKGIRSMLPDHRKGQGKQALLRIKCYNGIPKKFENEKMIKSKKIKPRKFIELKELSERI
jgi:ribosomal protein uL13